MGCSAAGYVEYLAVAVSNDEPGDLSAALGDGEPGVPVTELAVNGGERLEIPIASGAASWMAYEDDRRFATVGTQGDRKHLADVGLSCIED